jgi:hypothetical protein
LSRLSRRSLDRWFRFPIAHEAFPR